jgi:hypothetical protein
MNPKTLGVAIPLTGIATPIPTQCQALPQVFPSNTVLISHPVSPDSISSGSGFMVFHRLAGQPGSNQGKLYLVTDKHVLPHSDESD